MVKSIAGRQDPRRQQPRVARRLSVRAHSLAALVPIRLPILAADRLQALRRRQAVRPWPVPRAAIARRRVAVFRWGKGGRKSHIGHSSTL